MKERTDLYLGFFFFVPSSQNVGISTSTQDSSGSCVGLLCIFRGLCTVAFLIMRLNGNLET